MLPTTGVDEALDALLAQVETRAPIELPVESALGLVLAEPIISLESHPMDDKSAMDGYAVRCCNLSGASPESPVFLDLIEDIKAGSPPKQTVGQGQTSRISTGGLVPAGADAVIMREVVEVTDSGVRFDRVPTSGLNIRYAGEHISVGEEVVRAGTLLGPAEIGMAAFLGADRLKVVPQIDVGVLSTGSELVPPGVPLKRGQIRDSNSLCLDAALKTMGCRVSLRRRVADTPEALDAALEEAFEKSQVVLTSGGISAGWHDLVRGRIENMGGTFSFHKLRMRPGKPLAFGHCGESHFFCLPGNPVSTMVTFEVFVRPALRKMAGLPPHPKARTAILGEAIEKKKGFTIFFRGRMEQDGNVVRLTGPQGSHMLRSMVEADVLIRTEENSTRLEAGDQVTVFPI